MQRRSETLRRGSMSATVCDRGRRGAEARLAAQRGQRDVIVVDPMLSFEPYGIVLPRDAPELARAADRALGELAGSREIAWIYDKWFVRPLPGGTALGMPMAVEVRRSLELIGLPAE